MKPVKSQRWQIPRGRANAPALPPSPPFSTPKPGVGIGTTVPAALAAAPGTHDWAPEPPPMAKTAPSDGDPNPALRVCGVVVFPEPPTLGVSFRKYFFVDKYSCCDQDNYQHRFGVQKCKCRCCNYSHITGIRKHHRKYCTGYQGGDDLLSHWTPPWSSCRSSSCRVSLQVQLQSTP